MFRVSRLLILSNLCLWAAQVTSAASAFRLKGECEVRSQGSEIAPYQLSVGDVFSVTTDFRKLAQAHLTVEYDLNKVRWMVVTDRGPSSPSGDFPLTVRPAPRGILRRMGLEELGIVDLWPTLSEPEIQIRFTGAGPTSRLRLPFRGRVEFAYPTLQSLYRVGQRPTPRSTALVTTLKNGDLVRYQDKTYIVDLSNQEQPLREVKLLPNGVVRIRSRAAIHGRINESSPDTIEIPPHLNLQLLATGVPEGLGLHSFRASTESPPPHQALRPNTIFSVAGDESVYLVMESMPANHRGVAKLKVMSLLTEKEDTPANLGTAMRVHIYDPDAAFWVWQGKIPIDFLSMRALSSPISVLGTVEVTRRWRLGWLQSTLRRAERIREERAGTETQITDIILVEALK